ncbi:hypothetical protein ASG43_20685 [Aureimonas sp. Leaf454]|uniref:D-apionate lactonase n=1 Tax=Aureimonas sp. Leaf454 TaxID=1736381 RepID=UPI0006F1D0E5|nr:hypothetical protein [Aureimonas sp. Leaf454]KQT51997.1 hypothetical protein ASG43_20685 [Aureimonas sp. Leaf454]
MPRSASDLRKLYGTAEPPPVSCRLAAGALEADVVEGALRAVRWRGVEVLRAVAYVVRGRDWGTYAPEIEDLVVEVRGPDTAGGPGAGAGAGAGEASFALSYRATCRAASGAALRFSAQISGHATGRLVFAVEAVPDGDFETNRCGFCVLHPIESLAGRAATVTHTDGSVEFSRFPDLVEPWQPFKDIRAIAHEIAPGALATCRMEGDAFEMEDQRNWSDASYKTYVRPLALPWPYELPAGRTLRQSVTLTVADARGDVDRAPREGGRGTPRAPAGDAPAGAIRVTVASARGPSPAMSVSTSVAEAMPRFGVAVAPEEVPAALEAIDRLRDLEPRHLLLHFDPVAGHGAKALSALARLAEALPDASVTLECVVPGEASPAAELGGIAALVAASGLRPAAVVVGPSVDRRSTPPGSAWPDAPPLDEVYAAARAAFPGVSLGGGMFSYFTELNRKRVPIERLDFATHATCPIVHAADDSSVMQTLEALPFITRTANAILGPTLYHLGPTTIGMRQNPYGSRTVPNPDGRRIAMADDDPRQRGLFAAAWLVGYAARLAGSGVVQWTGASFAGVRGLLAGDGAVVPAFHVARALARLSGRERLPLHSADRSRLHGVAARRRDGTSEIWLANLTDEDQAVDLAALEPAEVSLLDLDGFDDAATGALPTRGAIPERLGAYAVLRIVAPTA